MPTYEYLCPAGHRFDRFQKMSDPPGADCPECGKAAERQISGGAGFLFKGEGFYITDSRSSEYKAKDKAESGTASGVDSKSPEKKGSSSTSGEKSPPGKDSTGGRGNSSPGSGGGQGQAGSSGSQPAKDG